MKSVSQQWNAGITNVARQLSASVVCNNGTVQVATFAPERDLVSITINATPTNGKFFGYTICKEAKVVVQHFADYDIKVGYQLDCRIGIKKVDEAPEEMQFPTFYISKIDIDENTGNATLTGYDIISKAQDLTFNNSIITYPKTMAQYAGQIGNLIGANSVIWIGNVANKDISFDGTNNYFNFAQTQSLREVLNAIAGATGTICFVSMSDDIVFISPYVKSTADVNITKQSYFTLKTGESVQLTGITSATELGDNITVGSTSGHNEILWDNGFLTINNQAYTFLNNIYGYLHNMEYIPYDVKWRGNPALEVGDTVQFTTKDNSTINTLYLGEELIYTGGLSAKSNWQETDNGNPDSNPTSLGEIINRTVAKVDKVKGEISLLASSVSQNTENIAELVITSGEIQSRVSVAEGNITTIQSTISQMPQQIKLAVEADIQDDFYAKVSSITIGTDGIEVKSTGSITLDSGADLTISSGASLVVNTTNFKVDSSGNVTIKGAISSGSTITGSTITGGSINIGNGKFKVNSDGSVNACGGNFNIYDDDHGGETVADCQGGFLVNGALMCDSINVYGSHAWSIESDGTCTGLKAIAVFGA